MTSKKTETKRLFIGSLPYRYSEGELLSLFIPEGKVVAVKIIKNRWGKSRGMGYVEFENLDDAIRAKNKFHGFLVNDRTIIVDYAQPDPLLTPEGRQRHEEARSRRSGKRNRLPQEKKVSRTGGKVRFSFEERKTHEPGFVPRKSSKSGKKIRQSVYDSRTHGSRVGAKFAAKNNKKKG